MLVIAAAPGCSGCRWRGRRHDDDPGAVDGDGVGSLFDVVFEALHDGEQVAVGFPDPAGGLHDGELADLLAELGRWRPWTALSTSMARWRATTSVLVWQSDTDDLDAAVEAFFCALNETIH